MCFQAALFKSITRYMQLKIMLQSSHYLTQGHHNFILMETLILALIKHQLFHHLELLRIHNWKQCNCQQSSVLYNFKEGQKNLVFWFGIWYSIPPPLAIVITVLILEVLVMTQVLFGSIRSLSLSLSISIHTLLCVSYLRASFSSLDI